jgi:lipoprotein-releasing system ATP-binding protein
MNNGSSVPAIEVHSLCKSYYLGGKELPVLKMLEATFQQGELAAITGVSGVGKSTLLHIMGTLDEPTSGEVLVLGRNPFQLPPSQISQFRNRSIGFIFQAHHLLPEFTACENVMIPLLINRSGKKEARREAESLLEEVGLTPRLNHKPGELSGGEQQRVAVARALVNRPAIIIADEPTGNLDEGTGGTIHNLLKAINKERGITIIIATHNLALASHADRRFRMVDGGLIEETLGTGADNVRTIL